MATAASPTPTTEKVLLAPLSLPLNLQGHKHPFMPILKQIRKAASERGGRVGAEQRFDLVNGFPTAAMPRTGKQKQRVLRAVCACLSKLIADNPVVHAKRPRGQSPRVAAPNAGQIAALLNDLGVHNPPLVDLAILLISTGCRRSEALGMRWQDIDFTLSAVSIRQVVIEHNGKWSIRQGTKSVAGQRSIRMPEVAMAALRRQQARVAVARLKLGRYWSDNDLVFPDESSGRARAPAAITKAFTRSSNRVAKLSCGWPEHASPVHSLRHAAATAALAAGVDIGTVSNRLGHSSPAVTLRIYISGTTDKDAAAGDAMAAAIPRKPRSA